MSLEWGSLIPNIAHDVRSLARKGLANAQLLSRALDPIANPEIAAHLQAIKESQQDLNHFFTRLVLLLEANLNLNAEFILLEVVLLAVRLELKEALQKAGVDLETGTLPVCYVPRKTQIILVELIDNSLRYRETARPLRIVIQGDEFRGMIRIRVSDNGSGFNPIYAVNLFQPFQRMDARRSGFGLGLAISKEITDACGGRIYWETPSVGAVFVLELPLKIAA